MNIQKIVFFFNRSKISGRKDVVHIKHTINGFLFIEENYDDSKDKKYEKYGYLNRHLENKNALNHHKSHKSSKGTMMFY